LPSPAWQSAPGRCRLNQPEIEYDRHLQSGGPLHADVTAFLLARGADPARRGPEGMAAVTEAETRGHWLAAEIMHAWIKRGRPPCTQ
jgi:hypothetical protein